MQRIQKKNDEYCIIHKSHEFELSLVYVIINTVIIDIFVSVLRIFYLFRGKRKIYIKKICTSIKFPIENRKVERRKAI